MHIIMQECQLSTCGPRALCRAPTTVLCVLPDSVPFSLLRARDYEVEVNPNITLLALSFLHVAYFTY